MSYCGRLSIDRRVLLFAEYMLTENATVRATANHFGYSKSTVHKDLVTRLEALDGKLYERITVLLNKNLAERHIRGGNATKRKYLSKDEES